LDELLDTEVILFTLLKHGCKCVGFMHRQISNTRFLNHDQYGG